MKLRFDREQRFTCSQCGRCCRRPWEIVVTASEVELYENNDAARWYREADEAPEGTAKDPFEATPLGLRKFLRIRKRPDGACGFLSPDNRCRIHEELGEQRKPLTCRMFPYRFHPLDAGETLVTTSFCCPTTVGNEGELLPSQLRQMKRLHTEWTAVHEEKPRPIRLIRGRRIQPELASEIRAILRAILDRRDDSGRADLRENVARMVMFLEDLCRYRVVRLKGDRLSEYVKLTGWFRAKSDDPVVSSRPSALSQLLNRGFLFVVAATRIQAEERHMSRWRLRVLLFKVLAHFHGLIGPTSGFDIRLMRRVPIDLTESRIQELVYNYLRATIETLGTGRRALVDELAVAVAFLRSAFAMASQEAVRSGRDAIDADLLTRSLMEAVDLTHADSGGILGRIITLLAGGVDQLRLLATDHCRTTE